MLEALLWGFPNAKSGLCFPSYEKIAEAAGRVRVEPFGPPSRRRKRLIIEPPKESD